MFCYYMYVYIYVFLGRFLSVFLSASLALSPPPPFPELSLETTESSVPPPQPDSLRRFLHSRGRKALPRAFPPKPKSSSHPPDNPLRLCPSPNGGFGGLESNCNNKKRGEARRGQGRGRRSEEKQRGGRGDPTRNERFRGFGLIVCLVII